MALPASNLNLSTVLQRYTGTASGSQLSLVNQYRWPNSNITSGVLVATPVNLTAFLGNFTSATGTLAPQAAFASANVAGWGVQAVVGIRNISYTVTGNRLTSITLDFYLDANSQGNGGSVGTNSPNLYIRQNGTTQHFTSTGTRTVSLNLTGNNTLNIEYSGNASTWNGAQAGANGQTTYRLIPNGLIVI